MTITQMAICLLHSYICYILWIWESKTLKQIVHSFKKSSQVAYSHQQRSANMIQMSFMEKHLLEDWLEGKTEYNLLKNARLKNPKRITIEACQR